ncbi:hypothetical protein TIFTF001_047059 [Ficus carica]|uniref:PTEN2A/B C2 domain-containing protein n=1 Tax=Ficus carica TaxID=3494 RepID=A0AA87YPT2_FICCA|nr:hypothetical protein TIFTF001_047056 [Ficus carica]GMN20204.1 hypothetical protein TIFTF001_047059 [Ficus carica]
MTENRKILTTADLDGFDKRKLPSPGFQVEVVLVDYNGAVPATPNAESTTKKSEEGSQSAPTVDEGAAAAPKQTKESGTQDKDDVFSDSEAEDGSSKSRRVEAASAAGERVGQTTSSSKTESKADQIASLTKATEQFSIANTGSSQAHTTTEPKTNAGASVPSVEVPVSDSEFKAMAADASVFSFGDDEDYESD